MRVRKLLLFALAAVLVTAAVAGFSWAQGGDPPPSLGEQALSPDPQESRAAIAALRAEGPKGLETLLEMRDPAWPRVCWSGGNEGASVGPAQRWCAAVDAVAKQRDASVSGLYWYTDLEVAKRVAQASGKPILSLRLLGRLDEDLSCANSRFFRLALYSNQEIASLLRSSFVLHWQSERPVPKVTIDFGDGRKLQQTITGNSVHYLLDHEGRPLDALPGLYGPAAFRRWLERAERLAVSLARGRRTQVELASYHRAGLERITQEIQADQSQSGVVVPLTLPESRAKTGPPTARDAALMASSKMGIESSVLREVLPASPEPTIPAELTWRRIAERHAEDARLDSSAGELLAREARNRAISPNALREFESSMALDTVRNEYLLHAEIHRWFIQGQGIEDLERLNEKIYTDLFLTPRSDPWLGLLPNDAYLALSSAVTR